MRKKEDRQANASFHLFKCKDVNEDRERLFKARALSMREAISWNRSATEYINRLQNVSAGQVPLDKMEEVITCIIDDGIDLLSSYPRIEQADRVDWESLSFEQLTDAVYLLHEVNSPFLHSQFHQSKQIEEAGKKLKMLGDLGVKLDGALLNKFIEQQDASESQ